MTLSYEPLAARMRPEKITDFVGQSHLTGEGKPLREAIDHKVLHSMILWGPPGSGKTTLAKLLARSVQAHIETLSAVTSGVKDIREVVSKAQNLRSQGKLTILFVDEVHRFNKAQQDAFLPFIENGTIILIGATTENPSFPRALEVALNAWNVYQRLGSPEGELSLAQAVIYLACAPKSNAVYKAYNAAQKDVIAYGSLDVPMHLRNAPTGLLKKLGYGKEYRYAHDEPQGYVAGEHYFPEQMPETRYYFPVDRGLEIQIKEKLARLRELDRKAHHKDKPTKE